MKGSGQTVLAGYDPTLLSLLQEVFPCNNKLVNRCAYKGEAIPLPKYDQRHFLLQHSFPFIGST